MIKYFEEKQKVYIDCKFAQDEFDKELRLLENKDLQLTSWISNDKYINENDVIECLLLNSVSDSDLEISRDEENSVQSKLILKDLGKMQKDFEVDESSFSYEYDIMNEPLNDLVKRLQEQERELNRKEEIQENERVMREKIIQESIENEANPEEIKTLKDNKITDWKEEVSNEVSAEFRKRCQARLKKNDNLNWIAYSERFQNLRLIKNMKTIK